MCNNGLNEKNSEEHHWKWVINTDGIERWHQEPRSAKVPQSFPTPLSHYFTQQVVEEQLTGCVNDENILKQNWK